MDFSMSFMIIWVMKVIIVKGICMAACFYFCLSIKTFEATIIFVVKDLITCLDFEMFGICIHFLREFQSVQELIDSS